MDVSFPTTNLKRVVIIGGGFGGMELAKKLDEKKFQIVLLDKNNYHTFQPLLYQIATGGLEPGHIAYPIRKIFQQKKNFHFRVANVQQVDASNNVLKTDIGDVHYDYLVFATGSTTNFFGNQSIQKNALPLKSMTEALDMRSLILQNCEEALLTKDKAEQQKLLDIVVVGGGPTGVEIAGALAELKKHALPQDYPELDFSMMNIQIVESGNGLIQMMSQNAQEHSLKSLHRLGVKINFNVALKEYDGNKAMLSDGNVIESKAVIWTAGVMGKTIEGINKEVIARGNRITVNEFNLVKGYENVFAIGDVAAMTPAVNATQDGKPPVPHPMLAPVAIQQASLLARNLNLSPLGGGYSTWKPFVYNDKGSMATIGRSRAVADLKWIKLSGIIAWLAWLFVHLIMLIGFRNRLVVLIYWIWNYISYDYAIRLIIRPYRRVVKAEQTIS